MTGPSNMTPNRLDQIKAFLGDLARPYAIIATATATSWAIFDGKEAGIITAAGVVVIALYTARAAENALGSRDAARVEVARTHSKETET